MVDEQATRRVRAVLETLVESGEEMGLQAAAYLDGELVVDAWAGLADQDTGRPVDGETLFTVFSTTKGITATCIHMLADRGRLEYDTPIREYWPEFGQSGKHRATVRDGLTHRIGIPQMPDGATPEMMCDWNGMCQALAAMEPLWEPGTKTGYHGYTFGWVLGEVVRRINGRPISQFVQDEICRPLGIEGLYIGIPDTVEGRVATLRNAPPPPDAPPPAPDSLLMRAIPRAVTTAGKIFNRPDVRRASIPGAGGIMSARGIARHYAMLAGAGALGGARLLTANRVETARTFQTDDLDVVIGQPTRKGMGYFLGGGAFSAMGPPGAFGHPGAGGSIGFADPDTGLAVGFTKNLLRMGDAPERTAAYLVAEEVRGALGLGAAG